MRWQGASRAECAQLEIFADRAFVIEWYQLQAPAAQWMPARQEAIPGGTRLIFTRNDRAFQVIVGEQRGSSVPFQLVYLEGLSDRQLADLGG
jgi:hypothetical protein